MLTVNLIEDFLQRVGLDDFDVGNVKVDISGDIIVAFDPDTRIEDVISAVEAYRPYRVRMVDNGSNFVEVHDTVYVSGMPVKVAYLCCEGESGFGTIVKIMVKSISCAIRGEMKTFLGFDDLRRYKERFIVD